MAQMPDQRGEARDISRDAALWKLSRVRRSIAVGSLALVGAFSAWVAQAKPGKSSSSTASAKPAAAVKRSGSAFAQPRLRPPEGAVPAAPGVSPVAPPPQAPVP